MFAIRFVVQPVVVIDIKQRNELGRVLTSVRRRRFM